MKRTIIVILLLSILAGSVFAQLSFSGEAYAGFQLEKTYDNDEIVSATHRKEAAPKFEFIATAFRENYGIKFDTTFQTTNPFTINGIYGWVDFLNNTIHLSMGKISDAKWVSSLDSDHEIFFDKITGFRLEYRTPLQGLNVGAAFPADDFSFEKFAKKIIFGASYVQALFNTVIAYDMGNNGRLLFGFNFTGIDDLTSAGIQFKANDFATWDNPLRGGEIYINEKVGYRIMRPLIVSLLAEQKIYKNPVTLGDPDSDVDLLFMLTGSYRILPVLTGSLTFGLGSPNKFNQTNFILKPCIEYSLKGPALFYVEYELNVNDIADKKQDNHRFGFGIDVMAF